MAKFFLIMMALIPLLTFIQKPLIIPLNSQTHQTPIPPIMPRNSKLFYTMTLHYSLVTNLNNPSPLSPLMDLKNTLCKKYQILISKARVSNTWFIGLAMAPNTINGSLAPLFTLDCWIAENSEGGVATWQLFPTGFFNATQSYASWLMLDQFSSYSLPPFYFFQNP